MVLMLQIYFFSFTFPDVSLQGDYHASHFHSINAFFRFQHGLFVFHRITRTIVVFNSKCSESKSENYHGHASAIGENGNHVFI